MPLFETTVPIDAAKIAEVVKAAWGLELGKLLKASQNHTFEAYSADHARKYSVRVTPDPEGRHLQRITDEIFFVNFLAEGGLTHICPPVPPTAPADRLFLVHGNLIVAVFEWARGVPLPFIEFRWMKDAAVIQAWGRFFAQMHKLSRKFGETHPEVAARIQNWDQVHSSILAGIPLHPDDQKDLANPHEFGILHGDLNTSNVHYVEDGSYLSVYDTDQVQRGFYLWDLAQALFTIVMLQDGGMPCNGAPVQGLDLKFLNENMIQGYESQGEKIDLPRLDRMVNMKKQLYLRFAKRAEQEGNIPADMAPFLKYINEFCEPKWSK